MTDEDKKPVEPDSKEDKDNSEDKKEEDKTE